VVSEAVRSAAATLGPTSGAEGTGAVGVRRASAEGRVPEPRSPAEERHGQDSGKIDPNVVVLDGIGLLFFLIPGLVDFTIDFVTGSIYLPPDVERGEGPFFD
jgi:hypothetical protein